MALDLGERRIGVAICDDGQTVATPLGTVDRVGDRTLEHDDIAELVETHGIAVVVVGLPLLLNGDVGPMAKKVLTETKTLRRRLGVEVVTHDERLSTVAAEGSLRAQGIDARAGRAVVDQVAAAVILQSWIDSRR